MKKLFTTLLLILLTLCLAACNEKSQANIANPVVEVSSIDEINEALKTHMTSVGVMGKSDERYSIISNKVGQYDFKLNGYEYTLRASLDTSEDISGIYYEGNLLFANELETRNVYGETSEYKAYRFLLGNEQYVLMVKDNGELSQDNFAAAYFEFMENIINEGTSEDAKALVGNYQDSSSQRANAFVSLSGINEFSITVEWACTADEFHSWYMAAKYQDDKLVYDSITHEIAIAVENGVDGRILDDYGAGYFEVKDGKLLWTGSGNNQTSSCIFEKIN